MCKRVEDERGKVKARARRIYAVSPLSRRPFYPLLFAAIAFVMLAHGVAHAQAKRVVVIKCDGLPHDLVDAAVRERDPRTGKSQLPWFDHVFYQGGTRVENFYVRGMSLSGPSWSLLDTGQHLQIKGNVEFDRYTLHAYDYLNFIPFYIENIARRRVDMPGPEVLDEVGLPLLVDAYANDERYISFQLHQRGTRWTTLQRSLQNGFGKYSPREMIDEWTLGFEPRMMIQDQLERELIEKLSDPRIRYLDHYTTEFDHAAHHNRDRAAHLYALKDLDAIVGRIWTAIQKTPQAAETALIVVSDHGINTDERVYSQGYNLVKLLGSRVGGGHHVITKRRLLLDYSVKGFYPLVPLITTTTPESYYLEGQSTAYPTALIDFDGNERSSIHLRHSDLNLLHILLQQLQRKRGISEPLRRALVAAFFSTLDRRRTAMETDLSQLKEELVVLRRAIEKHRQMIEAQPKKWTKEDQDAGRDRAAIRLFAQMDSWMADERKYTEYARTLTNLLALKRDGFDPARIKIEDVIAKAAMGDSNSIYELQNYVVGIAPGGLQLAGDGSLDMQKSFARVDYFSLLNGVSVRNNVQPAVDNRPVDFIATRIPREAIAQALEGDLRPDGDVIWIYGGPQQQALILSREENGRLSLRYLPIAGLRQESSGNVHFERLSWRAGLPLKIWEDKRLGVPEAERDSFLNAWHTDLEWLRVLHKTDYSNALVGLHEQLTRHRTEMTDPDAAGLSADERLTRRYRRRQRRLVEADLLVLARNHWNFDVRGFNPGGNHGSFFRISTHATLMFAGGEKTKIPRAAIIEEPYDSLSFMPTVLALTGQINHDRTPTPTPILWGRGFRTFPGRIIPEVLGETKMNETQPVAKGASETP